MGVQWDSTETQSDSQTDCSYPHGRRRLRAACKHRENAGSSRHSANLDEDRKSNERQQWQRGTAAEPSTSSPAKGRMRAANSALPEERSPRKKLAQLERMNALHLRPPDFQCGARRARPSRSAPAATPRGSDAPSQVEEGKNASAPRALSLGRLTAAGAPRSRSGPYLGQLSGCKLHGRLSGAATSPRRQGPRLHHLPVPPPSMRQHHHKRVLQRLTRARR